MRDPFANYDAWLERPYQDAIEEAERFYDWCEEHNIDVEHPDAETLYQDYIDAQWEPPEDEDAYLDERMNWYPEDYDMRYHDD